MLTSKGSRLKNKKKSTDIDKTSTFWKSKACLLLRNGWICFSNILSERSLYQSLVEWCVTYQICCIWGGIAPVQCLCQFQHLTQTCRCLRATSETCVRLLYLSEQVWAKLSFFFQITNTPCILCGVEMRKLSRHKEVDKTHRLHANGFWISCSIVLGSGV